MSSVGQREFLTQRRVIEFFQDALGYAYLGHWKDRPHNSNVEEVLLPDWRKRQGHSDKSIKKVLFELGKAAALRGSKTLYDANREVYDGFAYPFKEPRGAPQDVNERLRWPAWLPGPGRGPGPAAGGSGGRG